MTSDNLINSGNSSKTTINDRDKQLTEILAMNSELEINFNESFNYLFDENNFISDNLNKSSSSYISDEKVTNHKPKLNRFKKGLGAFNKKKIKKKFREKSKKLKSSINCSQLNKTDKNPELISSNELLIDCLNTYASLTNNSTNSIEEIGAKLLKSEISCVETCNYSNSKLYLGSSEENLNYSINISEDEIDTLITKSTLNDSKIFESYSVIINRLPGKNCTILHLVLSMQIYFLFIF